MHRRSINPRHFLNLAVLLLSASVTEKAVIRPSGQLTFAYGSTLHEYRRGEDRGTGAETRLAVLIRGDARALPLWDGTVDCCVTSPQRGLTFTVTP